LFSIGNTHFADDCPKPPEKKDGGWKVEKGSSVVHILLLAYLK